jgi:hypothetical protein
MSKRDASRRRHERDHYPTPREAVGPLVPHLRGIQVYADPCAGNGALMMHLGSYGLTCNYAGDLASGQDALARGDYGSIDAIITNPPYERKLMHALIVHFAGIAQTWLLLEADWAHTVQAIPYLTMCSDIVSVGRLKWITGTQHVGYDNFAWYRFDVRHSAGTVFHSRVGQSPTRHLCDDCGRLYHPARVSTSRVGLRFCSTRCRQRAHRARRASGSSA